MKFIKYQIVVFLVLAWANLFYGTLGLSHPQSAEERVYAALPDRSFSSQQVLGETISTTTTDIPPPLPTATIVTITSTPTLTPSPTTQPLKKNKYSIAVYGDSMVDTMGERLEYLEHALTRKYPNVEFALYNFGMGSQHVETGLLRISDKFDYQDRDYAPLPEIKPDIIIVGSFAYNPFSPYDRDRHWLGLTHLVQAMQQITSHVYMLAEIAPLSSDFGKGPNGVNWETNTSIEHAKKIVELLENAVGLSRTLNIPLINAYGASQGKKEYVNPSDGIHPSVAGHEFMAEQIVKTMKLDE